MIDRTQEVVLEGRAELERQTLRDLMPSEDQTEQARGGQTMPAEPFACDTV